MERRLKAIGKEARMKIKNKQLLKCGGALAASWLRAWYGTLDCRAAMHDADTDPADPVEGKKILYLVWHEYLPFPTILRRHCNISMLVSLHTDAELLAQAGSRLGFGVVRGSSSHRGKTRGGEAALRELMRVSNETHLTITPDGPRGPRRTMSKGPIYLASKLGMPIVASGFGYDRPWRLPTWDRFAIPRPFTRARTVLGPRMYLPPNLDRDGIEHYRQLVERMMHHLTAEAEAWAESGSYKAGEFPMRRRPLAGRFRRKHERAILSRIAAESSARRAA
jgi:lysophospholipid acyltransferase (LPLAT)-like uncharacterized protein